MKLRERKARIATIAAMVGCAALYTGCASIFEASWPGPGTPGLAGLPTADPSATRAYLATLDFHSSAKHSVVTCDPTMNPVTIDIYPEKRSHLVNPDTAATRGVIVARIVNTGPGTCALFGLAPGDTAYWWMGRNRGYRLTMEFYRIPAAGPVVLLAKSTRTHIYPDLARLAPDARISETPAHPIGPSDGDGGFTLTRFGHNSSWISCLGGCCESNSVVDAAAPLPLGPN